MLRMSVSRSESYKAAGVDVTAGYEAVKLMKPMVESTFTKGVMGTLGGFGGLFRPEFNGMKDASSFPVRMASAPSSSWRS